MQRTLNVRFLLTLLGSAALLVLACHSIHTLQVRRNAATLREQALRAEEQGQLQQTATYLGHYLAFAPQDTEALAHYGLTLEKLTHSPPARRRAFVVLEQVARREPGRQDVRQTLVRVALDLGLYADARKHLENLLQTSPDSAELERLLAFCEETAGDPARAADWLRKAVRHAPDHLDSHVRLAYLLRHRLGDAESADQALDAMIAANEQSAAAYLARARWRHEQGRPDEAGEDLARARLLAPDDAGVLLAFADWASLGGNPAEAESALEQALRRAPRAAGLHLALARLALQQGRPRQALERLQAGLQALPGQRDLLVLQAQVLIQERDFSEAERTLGQLEREGVAAELRRFLEAQVLLSKERWAEAANELEKLQPQVKGWPDLAFQVALALGGCRLQQGDAERSRTAYRQAVALDPSSAAARGGLGLALDGGGRADEALTEFQRAVELGERRPRVVQRLAVLLAERRRFVEADQVLRRLEKEELLNPDLTRWATEIALAQRDGDRAVTLARRLVSPDAGDYRDQLWLSHVLHSAGRREEAERVLRRRLEQSGKTPEVWIALVGQLAANQQRERAAVVLQEMLNTLPAEQRALTLARCHELLGQAEQAAEQYRLALKERPGDFLVLVQAAGFHLRVNEFAQAEPHLRKLIEPPLQAPPEHVVWARRQLALGLVETRQETAFQEALSLLGLNAGAGGPTLDDLRARARVLASRPEHQAEALRLLDATVPRAPLAPPDRLLLARLCEATHDLPRAREEMLKLVTGEAQTPQYLAEYIRCLRRWGDEDEARVWTEKLRELAPQMLP